MREVTITTYACGTKTFTLPELTDTLTIDASKLSNRAKNSLSNAGLEYLQDAVNIGHRLLMIENFGSKSYKELLSMYPSSDPSCRNCYHYMAGYSEKLRCCNVTVLKMASAAFCPPPEFGCNQWESK